MKKPIPVYNIHRNTNIHHIESGLSLKELEAEFDSFALAHGIPIEDVTTEIEVYNEDDWSYYLTAPEEESKWLKRESANKKDVAAYEKEMKEYKDWLEVEEFNKTNLKAAKRIKDLEDEVKALRGPLTAASAVLAKF